ncbi:efflux RND transporter periplasmic adaptor subunit [Chitinibacter bivalviorum]|uniref:Efflux RND transporter periplasmic adaptor subunit n=1 Tax=Chitinibacter bivalviorum TaxID=2739434 RepID=A0A7H9BJT8_9NEIS|nr:efflux RND transporter periplasmic adaptor subunit [Chitinibacter bivalviorum]QLG88576.1 efflux RND transporter periplasmic adaptor subunit [Chitinibacter bivalviorum]
MNRFLDRIPANLNRRRVLVTILAAFAVAGVGTYAVATDKKSEGKSDVAAPAKPVLTVSLIKPKTVEWAQNISANGNVVAWQESQIGTEVGGLRLIEVNAQVGDVVKKGQVLARYNDETMQAELAQAKASVAEAEAALNEATENANRVRQLGTSGSLSAQQITQAMTQERTAQARVQAAKAQLTTATVRMNQTRIVAPDDGVISSRTATLGSVSQPGQELFKLVRKGRLEWQAEVTSSESARIKVGQDVSLAVPTGKVLSGKVRQVAPTVDTKTRNVIVYVDIKNDESGLGAAKPGMFAKGNIAVGQGKALTLPGSAILLRDGFANVFVMQSGSKVKQVRVKLGRQAEGMMEVEGIAPDAQVVASGAGFLADGDTVRVVTK